MIPMVLVMPGQGSTDRAETVARWGASATGNQTRRLSGQADAQPSDIQGAIVLAGSPAAAGLRVVRNYDNDRRTNMRRGELGVFDLIDGKEDKSVLMNEPTNEN